MYCKVNYFLYTLIYFLNVKCLKSVHVNFHYNYNLQVEPFNAQIYKRELTEFNDKASFSFNGFEKVRAIPVQFPIDICIFSMEGYQYAATLHLKKNGAKHFKICKINNGSYETLADIPTPNGMAIDCIKFNNKGYVALALNLTQRIQYVKEGSAVYEITGNRMKAVQYFATPRLTAIYLHVTGNDFFLLQTYSNSRDTPNLYCPNFKWSGTTFNKIGHIPCSNARQIIPFSIDDESYVAVANYADQNGRTATNSVIYKYSPAKMKFLIFQNIPTNGAVDVEYFNVPQNEIKRHFVVFGNSISTHSGTKKESNNVDADSVIFLFDKSQFIPYQKLSFYAVKKLLPLQNEDAEKFLLLVACTDQDIKVYNFNDWQFEESQVQLTEGAFGKGVSTMRSYQEDEKNYLIIANTLSTDNETNVFLPIFKQEQHANALRQEISEWAKTEMKRLQTVNTEDLRKRVEEKLKNLEEMEYVANVVEIPEANLRSVTTESLLYAKLKMSTEYWIALDYIVQALDTLEMMLQKRLKRDAELLDDFYEDINGIYDTLNVKTLRVHKQFKAKKVNKVNSSNPEFKNIRAKKVIANNKYIKPLQEKVSLMENADYTTENATITITHLQFSGKFNQYSWSDLLNNTLKRQQQIQFLQSPIEIENLKTYNTVVKNDKVNEQDLAALVHVNGGKFAINQQVEFAKPLNVNKLVITDRLNTLQVFNGQFNNVLLRKSKKTQIIEGFKNISNIKIMDILITGKTIGCELEAISPCKFIHEPLILQGDFTINGDAHVHQLLNTSDIIDSRKKLSTKDVLTNALRMDTNLKNINFKFEETITANDSLLSIVNSHDLQRLVKLNYADLQTINGLKVFNDSLEIKSGISDVKYLNGIDIRKLQSNAFLKNNNQTINVPVKIGKFSTESIQSPVILLNDKNLSDYLTLTGNQSIEGSLMLDNLKVKVLEVDHFITQSKIFHQNLQDIYQQKSRNIRPNYILKKNRKFHGSIYVQNLILNSTINNKPIEVIADQIMQFVGDIKHVGNIIFYHSTNTTNLTFHGKLNGINASEFGKCWLQKKIENQVFTAPQTFATVNAERGIILPGTLNGFTMEEFKTKTYWINRNEYISCVHFETPISIKVNLITKTLNDYKVPHDVFYINSKKKPITLKSLTVSENFTVDGSVLNFGSINNVKLNELQRFLRSDKEQTLYVENAYFLQAPPGYKTLNRRDIMKTLDLVWLANESAKLSNPVEIRDGNFESLLEFNGPINGIELRYLKENYFSKSTPQNISIDMVFSQPTEVANELYLNNLKLISQLIQGPSGQTINFNKFVRNTVKTSGTHRITGNWLILKAIIKGNLNNVLINGFNFVDDILRIKDQKNVSRLKAPKTFESIHIENLHASPSSLVNRVPVYNWVKNSVYLYENYTIKGTTTIDQLNVHNNLMVFGKLNNISFNEHELLLQNNNQKIEGNVKIVTYMEKEGKFLTNNMEYLYVDYINQQYVPTFLQNLIHRDGNKEIISHLTFNQALKVERYDDPNDFLAKYQGRQSHINNRTRLNRHSVYDTYRNLKKYENVKGYFVNISKSNIYKLSHFDILQTIETNYSELFMLNIAFDGFIVDILVVSDKQSENIKIFKWIPKKKQFHMTKEFDWLPHNSSLLKIINKKLMNSRQPINAEQLKLFIQKDLEVFHKVLNEANNGLHNYFQFLNQTCVQYQSNISPVDMHTFCLNFQSFKNVMKCNDEVLQVEIFDKNSIAFLTHNSILIYDIGLNSSRFLQKISLTQPKKMTFGTFKNYRFLAVFIKLYNGLVEIYRSVNSSIFALFQTLDCSEPLSLTFSYIEKSNDFLLHVLPNSMSSPYLVYQYKGIMGFTEILSNSILPSNLIDINILNLYAGKTLLVALNGKENITLVELVLNQV